MLDHLFNIYTHGGYAILHDHSKAKKLGVKKSALFDTDYLHNLKGPQMIPSEKEKIISVHSTDCLITSITREYIAFLSIINYSITTIFTENLNRLYVQEWAKVSMNKPFLFLSR